MREGWKRGCDIGEKNGREGLWEKMRENENEVIGSKGKVKKITFIWWHSLFFISFHPSFWLNDILHPHRLDFFFFLSFPFFFFLFLFFSLSTNENPSKKGKTWKPKREPNFSKTNQTKETTKSNKTNKSKKKMCKQWVGEFIVSTINLKFILCCLWDQLLEVSVHIHGSCKIILNFPLSIVFNSQIFGNFLEMRSLQRLSSDAKVERDSISNNLCLGTLFIYLFMFLDWIWSLQIARKTNLEVVEGVMVRWLLEEFFFFGVVLLLNDLW